MGFFVTIAESRGIYTFGLSLHVSPPKLFTSLTKGTHFRLTHRGCNGQTLKCRCIKCHTVCGGTCSVCDGTLLHMTWFCRKCHHAAHPHHILEWFTTQRVCPVASCMCECGISLVQTPQEKKMTVARSKTFEAIRERSENCLRPTTALDVTTSSYESSSESDDSEESDESLDTDITMPSSAADFEALLADPGLLERTETPAWRAKFTLLMEKQYKKMLQNSSDPKQRQELSTVLYWLQFYRLIGPKFLQDFQQKQTQKKPDLEAERQAYDLFYEYQAKQHKESDGRFPIEEVPEEFVELRGFLFPMGSEYGPLNADQTRSRNYYERILNGENDPEEVEEVAEWERRSLAEYEESLSRKKSKKRKKTGDEVILSTPGNFSYEHLWATKSLTGGRITDVTVGGSR